MQTFKTVTLLYLVYPMLLDPTRRLKSGHPYKNPACGQWEFGATEQAALQAVEYMLEERVALDDFEAAAKRCRSVLIEAHPELASRVSYEYARTILIREAWFKNNPRPNGSRRLSWLARKTWILLTTWLAVWRWQHGIEQTIDVRTVRDYEDCSNSPLGQLVRLFGAVSRSANSF